MNAYETSKDVLFTFGVKIASEFLKRNDIDLPNFKARSLCTDRAPSGSYGCGVYLPRFKSVLVNPYACATPAKGTPRQWSFPGYTPDRTPVGVVCHEVGHFVDDYLDYPSAKPEWSKATKGSRVSSYEPNSSEAFAESMRLFITNPAMLNAVAPRRFAYLADTLRLLARPGVTADPLAQLVNWGATPAILHAASNKAGIRAAVN